ncbi:hypothetical protein BpHYR1_048765 [Brachionus plicatilis]|uniref:Uncharacterized protein n=1 Tax=Brachionus plicatilis TaxID=10195 RepID=A0A3M7QBA8_BRAPC|nr:hypothetical protein BpHYR1_048765 [Brachionus plicatilis]
MNVLFIVPHRIHSDNNYGRKNPFTWPGPNLSFRTTKEVTFPEPIAVNIFIYIFLFGKQQLVYSLKEYNFLKEQELYLLIQSQINLFKQLINLVITQIKQSQTKN